MRDDHESRFTPHNSMPLLEIRHLRKSYPGNWTLHDVSFVVEEGERLCLLGPSGCGKTTLLRLIAGLEMPDAGQMLVDGENMTTTPPHLRGFGLMFQEYALFPHKDVFGNVAFGLRMQGLDRETVTVRVAEALDIVGLGGFEQRDVNQLSGGERQRVALARSLAPQPRLLMLDEPLGALDRALRERLMDDLPKILHRAGVTTITVTHDQEEAFALADRVVLMRAGRVVQVGTPEDVYRQPASAWVARFLGLTNLLDAHIVGRGLVETAIGTLQVPDLGDSGLEAQLLIRPEAAGLDVDSASPNVLHGVVVERSFRGEHYRLGVRHAGGVELTFNLAASVTLPAFGESITLFLEPQALALLPTVKDSVSDDAKSQ
ncbi:MAG: ABC transporter ATP-binding protein [Chloroflexi bacterium]|nr:ABC transporter ATP-binding protein [Chloroflexota bacterium]